MAKKKAKKLPKTLAGVKISKKVRKQGAELLATVNTPLGRELLAAGLVAAGAAIAKREETRKVVARVAGAAEETAEDAAARGARVASQIGGIVGAAANAALDRLLGAGEAETDNRRRPKGPPPGSTAH